MSSFTKAKEDQKNYYLTIQDTAFLLRVLSKAEVKIEDIRQVEITVSKIKKYHERLMAHEINPISKRMEASTSFFARNDNSGQGCPSNNRTIT